MTRKVTITVVDEINCLLDGLSRSEITEVQEAKKFREKSAHMTAAFRLGEWDGYTSMI